MFLTETSNFNLENNYKIKEKGRWRLDKQPHIILLFADDLGIGDVSAFNPEAKFETKNIDELAKAGIKFTDSHAPSA